MKSISGHNEILKLLGQTIQNGKPAHAYMFVGPEGVGKKLVGLRFAAMLNCPEQNGDSECSCPVCERVIAGKHPDIIIAKPERNSIRIDKIRELQSVFKYAPVEGLSRVAIIDDAHMLNRSAQNALLKVLEEPPPGRVLLLVTSKPGAMAPTIRSRCRKIRFSPFKLDDLAKMLEAEGASAIDARVAAALSGGSLSKSTEMLKSDSIAIRATAITFFSNPLGRRFSGVLEVAAEMSSDVNRAQSFLDISKSWVRDVIIDKIGNDDTIHDDFSEEIHRLSAQLSIEQLMRAYEELIKASELIQAEFHVNRNLIFDVMLLNIARNFAGPQLGRRNMPGGESS